MAARTDNREDIAAALNGLGKLSLADASVKLFAALGYQSSRRIPIATSAQFCEQLDPHGKLSDRERESLDQLNSLHLLFQFTDAELAAHSDMFDDPGAVHATRIESYLFFAVELPSGQYPRAALSTLVRAVNKPLPMPALVLIKHGDAASLGVVHRRLHKRDQARDVLEKVTLVKDITFADPIRAHVEILNDFAFANLDADFGIANFVALHEAWQKRLGSYALSNDFYREIADWYFWAHHQVEDGTITLPQHCDTEQEQSLFLIRLLTRVIFCWFLVEKRLIPTDLFREHRLRALLKDFKPSKDSKHADDEPSYYHAILQNLFFGTLNMPPEQRAFREKKKDGERYDQNYGITNLWRYEANFREPAAWVDLAKRIPFLNGGLFDCLDEKAGKRDDNFILDGFSDNPKLSCRLPNDLFFGAERTVDLSRDYGEEDKRTARSKKAKVRGLIEILSRYKFTIEENTPLEEEIALDPELLGKVFENLLASYNEDTKTTARKALGAFYTPREIVSYMVDEALKSYLAGQVPRCKGALEDLFSNKATLRDIQPDQRDALIAAIGRVKILDPACGSGAFPMGALHRLVDLLQKLDPNNESWKRNRLADARRQLEALGSAGAAEDEIVACYARISDIERSFDSRYHLEDFGRKLHLIENSIYGVDIQPIATQIAKLRFFIALIVDQKIDTGADNLGVRPLPNLETRIVAADALVPIEKVRTDLFSGDIDRLRKELAEIRHEHFNARNPTAKRRWRVADKAKRGEIAALLEEGHSLTNETAARLAAWDPYDQNSSAPFFDVEWMFGGFSLGASHPGAASAEVGFDIVVGNPPYIRLQTLKKKDERLVSYFKEQYASAAKGNYDIYVVFIEVGLRLLKSDGHLAYICPHKFFNADYGEPIRQFIAAGKYLRHVVHFGDGQVFLGATIYTCLLFLAKGGSPACRFVRAELGEWLRSHRGTEGTFPAERIGSSQWNFTVGSGASVFEHLQDMPSRLGDHARIWQGMVTGADKVFVVERLGAIHGSLISVRDSRGDVHEIEASILRRFLKDVSLWPYGSVEGSHLLLFPYSVTGEGAQLLSAKVLKSSYPNAWRLLNSHRATLVAREGGTWDHGQWYAFGRNQNMTQMEGDKLVVQVIAQSPRFSFDAEGYYFTGGGNGPYYGVRWLNASDPRSLHYLQAVLNSRVADYFVRNVSTPFRGGYWSYGKRFIEQIPIPSSSRMQEGSVVQFVRILLFLTRHFSAQHSEQTKQAPLILAYWERALNGLVYELYFPAEVHGAGLRMFEIVAQAELPDLAILGEPGPLPRLQELFETFYDGDHPLRIALDKLQALDIVRTVEGKT